VLDVEPSCIIVAAEVQEVGLGGAECGSLAILLINVNTGSDKTGRKHGQREKRGKYEKIEQAKGLAGYSPKDQQGKLL
jgi:hypothetical protein